MITESSGVENNNAKLAEAVLKEDTKTPDEDSKIAEDTDKAVDAAVNAADMGYQMFLVELFRIEQQLLMGRCDIFDKLFKGVEKPKHNSVLVDACEEFYEDYKTYENLGDKEKMKADMYMMERGQWTITQQICTLLHIREQEMELAGLTPENSESAKHLPFYLGQCKDWNGDNKAADDAAKQLEEQADKSAEPGVKKDTNGDEGKADKTAKADDTRDMTGDDGKADKAAKADDTRDMTGDDGKAEKAAKAGDTRDMNGDEGKVDKTAKAGDTRDMTGDDGKADKAAKADDTRDMTGDDGKADKTAKADDTRDMTGDDGKADKAAKADDTRDMTGDDGKADKTAKADDTRDMTGDDGKADETAKAGDTRDMTGDDGKADETAKAGDTRDINGEMTADEKTRSKFATGYIHERRNWRNI